jgi:DNA-binding beta-propeller fold protein YncE
LEVVFPAGGTYDRDGDGLMEVELAFTDAASGVDPATIRLMVGGRDVLSEWEVTRRDSTGLVAEETVAGLLPAGRVTLGISVSDHAGNVRQETRFPELPEAILHRSIPLPFDPVRRVQDVVMRPDGEVLFAVDETSELLLVDPNEYRLVAQPSGPLNDLQGVEFDAQRNRVYAVSFLHPGLAEFDGSTGQFLRLIPTTQGAFALALSRQTAEVYIPLEIEFEPMNGILSVVDREVGQEVALIQSGITDRDQDGSILGQHAAVLTEDEQRLYIPTVGNGVLVYDPADRSLVQQVDLLAGDERLGTALGAERAGDDLYVNVFRDFHVGAAVYQLDASTGAIRTIKSLGAGSDISTGAAASPDGTRLFVTGISGSRSIEGAASYLLALPTLEILARLDGAVEVPQTFGYNGVAWHPDGKRAYVAASDFVGGRNEILVYLVRP